MRKFIFILLLGFSIIACEKSDTPVNDDPDKEIVEEEEEEVDPGEPDNPESPNIAGEILIHDFDRSQKGFVLVNDVAQNKVYLMEKENAEIVFEWDMPVRIANDAFLLDNGNLLVALIDEEPAYTFGGYGGRLAIISPSNDIILDYSYSDDVNLSHHDLQMLPNGNILFLAWEKKSGSELEESGYAGDDEAIYAEKLLEIDPNNNQIVWQWNSWDHIIQEVDESLENYGTVSENPQLININYVDHLKEGSYEGDIMHANGLEYDEERDLIFLSVNFFSEVWVIDHSTSIEQASSNSGGNFNKGGDLVYRFGNPAAYNNEEGGRMFYHNHTPALVPENTGLLVFSNGIPAVDAHSTVYELNLPEEFELKANTNNELEIAWSFMHEDLFSPIVSGAYRLPNGNTLITEGSDGFWEVTESGEIVWLFEGEGFFWRGYHYNLDSPAIEAIGL